MKNHRFLWLRNRTTDNRKCEKARNIKEKCTIEMFSTASRLLVARPSSASAEFPSVPSILRPMAVMAVMGRFCMQSVLCKRSACTEIMESLAEPAFSGLFKREICAKSGGSYLHNDVFFTVMRG